MSEPSAEAATVKEESKKLAPKDNERTDGVVCRCADGEPCVTFSTRAGKKSTRKGQTDFAMGPTTFWLACRAIHSFVGKLEFLGAVPYIEQRAKENDLFRNSLLSSHEKFLAKLKEQLDEEHYEAYLHKFVQLPPPTTVNTSGENAKEEGAPEGSVAPAPPLCGKPPAHGSRRHGNAAVSHPLDVKCLHAHVASTLAGVDTPPGCAVLWYLASFAPLVSALSLPSSGPDDKWRSVKKDSNDERAVGGKSTRRPDEDQEGGDQQAPVEEESAEGKGKEDPKEQIRTRLKDLSDYKSFVESATVGSQLTTTESILGVQGGAAEASASLCTMATAVFQVVQGHALKNRSRKKKRLT